jgi:hypothetical protein
MEDRRRELMVDVVKMNNVRTLRLDEVFHLPASLDGVEDSSCDPKSVQHPPDVVKINVRNEVLRLGRLDVLGVMHGEEDDIMATFF